MKKILDYSLRDFLPKSKRPTGHSNNMRLQAISRARQDIIHWKQALMLADNVQNPRRYKLIDLYENISLDALLTSQIELRVQKTLGCPFVLKNQNGEINEKLTTQVKNSQWFYEITRRILETNFWGHTAIEFTTDKAGDLIVTTLNRKHVVPEKGLFLKNPQDTKGFDYRNAREYGKWLLEFGEDNNYGIFNKAIPHVLFKKFAQACWSELCEIYGIPPRYMKTNTQDPEMLKRAETMMQDMGAAAWFIIDDTEEFNFAKGADTNGDVYANLMQFCSNELSLLITGAVLGQDTKNGNRSKEQVSLGLFDSIVAADKRFVETSWNEQVLKALYLIGLLPDGLLIEFQPEEDLEKLWKMTSEAMSHFEVDPTWVKSKFGIEILGKKQTSQLQFSNPESFFV
jgi:phage gp29-like protein